MKKYLRFFLILMFFSLIFAENAEAKEALYNCKYDVQFSKVYPVNDDLTVYITIYDDDSYAMSDNINSLLASGNILGKLPKKYIQEVRSQVQCPDIGFVSDGNGNFNLQYGNTANTVDAAPVSKAVKEIISSNIQDVETTIVCSKTKAYRNGENNYDITFYTVGDTKMFKVNSATSKIGGVVSIDGITFMISEEEANKYFNNCDKTDMWVKCNGGSSDSVTLQSSQPADVDNCSYNVNDADKDNGKDADENPAGDGLSYDKSHHSSWLGGGSGKVMELVKRIYNILTIGIPLLIILLSIVDFLKVTFLSDEKNYKEAWNKFIKRIVVGIAFFLLPQILSLIINITGLQDSGIIFEILS